jgi:hypothetical protein
LQPIDTNEIVEARKASFGEVTGKIRKALCESGSPGLRYRAELDGIALLLMRKRRPLFYVPTRVVIGFLILSILYFGFLIPNGQQRKSGFADVVMLVGWFGIFIVPILAISVWELICRRQTRKTLRCDDASRERGKA